MENDSLGNLEKTYQQVSKGVGAPDFAIIRVPGFGVVELIRGGIMQMNGRDATKVEWHMMRGWIGQRNNVAKQKAQRDPNRLDG